LWCGRNRLEQHANCCDYFFTQSFVIGVGCIDWVDHGPHGNWPCVVWLFDFIKNCWFQLLNYFRIRESPILILWEKFKTNEAPISVISRTLKDQHFFMQDLAKNSMNWWFYAYVLEFFKNLKIMTIYQNWVVEFCLESWLWLRGAILITVEDLFLCWLVWVQVISQISKFTDR